MKKLTLSVLMLGVMLFVVSGFVAAEDVEVSYWININDLSLNGQDQVTVDPAEVITAEVETENHYASWRSTGYIIQGQGEICVDTPNHYSNGMHTESFPITAPSSEGTYDFTVKVYHHESCNSYGDSETLDNGIIVVEEECSDCDLEIINPLTGEFYSGYELLIDWIAEGEDCGLEWDVYYGEYDGEECTWETHLGETHIITELLWNIEELEGEYCVKVEGDCCEDAVEGPFCIDQTEPEVEVCVEGCCPDGIESDEQTPETETTIDVEYSDYSCGDECIVSCEIDWGDGETTNCYGRGGQYTHQYGDNGLYTVTVTVEDCAENVGEATEEVEVENVDPVCDGIDAPSDAAIGQPVMFTGYGSDVDADLPLIFNWNFDDGETADDENPTTHTFDDEGEYTVELVIEDKDGGVSNTCYHEIDVVEPILLDDQEVAAFYELDAYFGSDAGDVPNSFETIITPTSDVTCDAVVSPVNMQIWGNDNDCVVKWGDATERPKNVEQGTHLIVVRVSNGVGDYEYYTFDTIVYSWIIPLDEGWNLFSIPLVHETGDIEDVLPEEVSDYVGKIWSYEFDPVAGESVWYCRKTTSTSWSSVACATGVPKLEQIVPGRSYWMEVDEGETAVVKGFGTELGTSPGMPPSTDVPVNQWSLVGTYGILGDDFADPEGFGYDAWYDDKGAVLDSLYVILSDLNLFSVEDTGGYWSLNPVEYMYNNNGYWLWLESDTWPAPSSAAYAPTLEGHYYENDDW